MGFPLPEGLKYWTIHIQQWKENRHVNRFYIGRRGWTMWFINIPRWKYITIYKIDTTKSSRVKAT